MPNYEVISDKLCRRMEYEKQKRSYIPVGFPDSDVVRRYDIPRDVNTVWRPAFVHDTDKILHCPYYNRYTDKTQVFSLYRNDDITRRSLHVQLVSRIARTIGAALNLNIDLIEAISLGHDIGHTPFAHAGEKFLDASYFAHTGRHFYHNIHSVRVLDKIFPYNISLQTLCGIASHNGESELMECHPSPIGSFDEFDALIERCYTDRECLDHIAPTTMEGCVVRISDIIAYLGKDRQDAVRAKLIGDGAFIDEAMGSINSEIINNLVVNIIENSYGRPYIKIDREHFDELQILKRTNYALIYDNASMRDEIDSNVKPMMSDLYERLLSDLIENKTDSPVFTHHIEYVNRSYKKRKVPYGKTEPNQIIVDYIASMTDDYFIDLYRFLFPDSKYDIEYHGYFD